MKQLEARFYPRSELLVLFSDFPKKHFARDVRNILTKWGYSFEYTNKGVTITRIPTTAEEKLSELLIRELNLDIRIDTQDFAIWLALIIQNTNGFAAMPQEGRVDFLKEYYDLEVSRATLYRWQNRLFKDNIIAKSAEKSYWKTYIDGSREPVAEQDPERLEWWNDFHQSNKDYDYLWKKYGYTTYACPKLLVGAFSDVADLELFLQLVNIIAKQPIREYVEIYETKLVIK